MTRFANIDEEEDGLLGGKTEHAAFGMIELHSQQGSRPLFGVDYPTGHSISMTISTGALYRKTSGDRFHAEKIVAKIELSEVQWARLVSSMNSTGVPCTLRYTATGPLTQHPEVPGHTKTDRDRRAEVGKLATRVAANLAYLRKLAEEMAAPGGTVSKAKAKEMVEWAQQTEQAIQSDMPFLTQCQQEHLQEMEESAKAEIDAHIQFSLNELGRKALGEKMGRGGVMLRLGEKNRKVAVLEEKNDDAE